MIVNALIYDEFLELDLFGALAIFKNLDAKISYLSLNGGEISGASSATLLSQKAEANSGDVLLVPGGAGARKVIDDERFIGLLKGLCKTHTYVLSVCTGGALLARAGLLSGKSASTNHAAFEWVKSQDRSIKLSRARYSKDGKYYTSAGVSAGIDMTLKFVRDALGDECARDMARKIEWQNESF
ncbi:DJ-1/PfpI family protein [Campylobacter sp. 19-13652]|uniref:DJ-1/PfpI family protein n=1 Tax=Campylobacter sp. 19-13652 TaxID=2840180 RepID=UPI001C789425|nr:DJ-1/PfpI family protein [Campylobacter sp. 19-13652]BCX78689.1 dimethyladenosine transferase [Campylobacter sp. 19-13652]BCX78775.1 dimethyladenosine transferase [Campylobacter sp. 19-13652]